MRKKGREGEGTGELGLGAGAVIGPRTLGGGVDKTTHRALAVERITAGS